MVKKKETEILLDLIRDGRPMTLKQQLHLTVKLSVPAIITQLSSIIMQYIDAAMVGRISAEASASIGLVSTSTWLFWGLCTAAATGFSVQVAHKIGAGDDTGARMVLRQALVGTLLFSLLLAILGAGISSSLPAWLGGDISIRRDASVYFLIFSIFHCIHNCRGCFASLFRRYSRFCSPALTLHRLRFVQGRNLFCGWHTGIRLCYRDSLCKTPLRTEST